MSLDPDPTLLNLARRQGWLIASQKLTPERIQELRDAGASHLAGSFQWQETYNPLPDKQRSFAGTAGHLQLSPLVLLGPQKQTYLLPIDGTPGNF